jgi:hypothetical protein
MPTPDKTMDDVSKLVSHWRERMDELLTNGTFAALAIFIHDVMPKACDALESVAKENADLRKEQETDAAMWKVQRDTQAKITAQLAAVAKERDAAMKALEEIQNFKPSIFGDPYEHIAVFSKQTARAALEKLDAK